MQLLTACLAKESSYRMKRNTNVLALVSVHRVDASSVADSSEVHAASIFRAEELYIFCNTAQIHTVQKCRSDPTPGVTQRGQFLLTKCSTKSIEHPERLMDK
jgi:hypothetical protein